MKKIIFVVLSAILACSVAFSATGCGRASGPKTDEDFVKEAVATHLESFKNPGSDFWQKAMKPYLNMADTGNSINSADYVGALIDGFNYEIVSVVIKEDGTAEATVNLFCKQLKPAIAVAGKSVITRPEIADGLLSATEANNVFQEEVIAQLQAAELAETSITVLLNRNGETWVVDTSDSALQSAHAQAFVGIG